MSGLEKDNSNFNSICSNQEPDDCPICLKKIESKIFETTCKHKFCFDCIRDYSKVVYEGKQNFHCPLCRTINIIQKYYPVTIDKIEIGKIYLVQRLHLNYQTNKMYVFQEYNTIVDSKGISPGNVPYIKSGYNYIHSSYHKFFEYMD
jgi:hypothetical protein